MIISFSVFKEKIENGEKCQTIRPYSPAQYQRYLNCWKKRETTGRYNLFWHNPRNGGTRIKDVIPEKEPFILTFQKGALSGLTGPYCKYLDRDLCFIPRDIWERDGFKNPSDMAQWFYEHYGEGMYQNKFIVIRWNS